MRSMVEGAQGGDEYFCVIRRSVDASAPPTARAVPPPRYRGAG